MDIYTDSHHKFRKNKGPFPHQTKTLSIPSSLQGLPEIPRAISSRNCFAVPLEQRWFHITLVWDRSLVVVTSASQSPVPFFGPRYSYWSFISALHFLNSVIKFKIDLDLIILAYAIHVKRTAIIKDWDVSVDYGVGRVTPWVSRVLRVTWQFRSVKCQESTIVWR